MSWFSDRLLQKSMIVCLQLQWLCTDRNDCVPVKKKEFWWAHNHWRCKHTIIHHPVYVLTRAVTISSGNEWWMSACALSKISDCVLETSMIVCQPKWLCAHHNPFVFDQYTIISVGTQLFMCWWTHNRFGSHIIIEVSSTQSLTFDSRFIDPWHSFITHCSNLWSPRLC